MLHQRHYTAEQANALLPEVRATVRRLQDAKRVLQDEGFDTGFATLADVVGGAFPGRVRAQAAVAATLGFEHLEELDLLVRDLEAGLIDFPALRDGREVYLCWQVDEHEVGHWHAAETGYPSRLPLDPWLVAAASYTVLRLVPRGCVCAHPGGGRRALGPRRAGPRAADGRLPRPARRRRPRGARRARRTQPPDAIVLDVLMPEPDGLEVCRRLRAAGDRTPVLMLTARDAVPDRVQGPRRRRRRLPRQAVRARGARRAAARAAAAQRRPDRGARCATPASSSTPPATPSHRGGRPIELTRTEFLLLELLLRHPRQVLTRTQIFEHVWGYDFGPSSNSLEVYVGYLRRKLGEPRLHPDGPRRRLRPARAVSFRRRLALSCGAAVAVVGRARLACSRTGSCATRCATQIDNALRSQVDASRPVRAGPGPGDAGPGRPRCC